MSVVLIFANPRAGRGRGLSTAGEIERAVTGAGYQTRVSLDRPDGIEPTFFGGEIEAAVCVGGDGTLRGVVDRFGALNLAPPPLLPVPLGTANLMGRHLGISWPADQTAAAVVATIRRRHVVRRDAGRANGSLFLLMAGVGLDGRVVHLLDQVRSGPIDLTSYVVPAAMTFAGYSFPAIEVVVDGRTVFEPEPGFVVVGNVREYGTGFPILTRADATDGLLDVCAIPCRDRLQLMEILLHISLGDHADREGVVYLRGKNVTVKSAEKVPVQLDGDPGGFTPLDVEVVPAALRFLTPVSGE